MQYVKCHTMKQEGKSFGENGRTHMREGEKEGRKEGRGGKKKKKKEDRITSLTK